MPSTDANTGAAPLMLSVSGCRGIVGSSLTPETVARYVGAFVAHVRCETGADRPRVVLARDGRRGGEALRLVAIGSLAGAGCDVVDLDVATTPTAGIMVRQHGADAGLVLTASHNPAQWNGLKPLTREGAAPAPDEAARLIERYRAGDVSFAPAQCAGAVTSDDTAAHVHVDRVLTALGRDTCDAVRGAGLRAVVDSVNASGATGARLLCDALDVGLVHINADGSGQFPHPPEPLAEHLGQLCGKVAGESAHVGFAQDPDADRLAIVDERGRFIGEEYTLVLGALSLLRRLDKPSGAVLGANLSTSRMIDDLAGSVGARVARAPVGEANVVSAMRERGCVLGGEGNGGVIWPEVVMIRDSIGAMGLVLALLATSGRRVSELVADVPAYAIEKRKVPVRDGLARAAMDATVHAFEGATIDRQDGVRADFALPDGGRGWVHVRPSNTEPIIRLIGEAPTIEQARGALDRVEARIGAIA